uniref:Lipoxygenase domain-containing protein n=1 Tax=Oncorhynchus mykiss TaxID=8022 RepID=A0A8K9VBG1_ONCMY
MQGWTCICLIICSMQSVCHCCDWIRHHYGHLSAEYLSLLDQMGGDITEQEAPVFFPESLYRRIELADVKTRILTFHVLICFSIAVLTQRYIDGIIEPYSAVTWDKKKLDDFLNILEGQFENLKSQNYHDMTRKSIPLICTFSFVFQNYTTHFPVYEECKQSRGTLLVYLLYLKS